MPTSPPRSRRSRVAVPIWIALLGVLVAAPLARGQLGELTGIVPHHLNPATPSEGRTEVTLR